MVRYVPFWFSLRIFNIKCNSLMFDNLEEFWSCSSGVLWVTKQTRQDVQKGSMSCYVIYINFVLYIMHTQTRVYIYIHIDVGSTIVNHTPKKILFLYFFITLFLKGGRFTIVNSRSQLCPKAFETHSITNQNHSTTIKK